MTALFPSPDRRVVLGSLAVRPVRYLGALGGTPFPSPAQPIDGLVVRSTSDRRAPIFHLSTNVYGFLDLVPAAHRIHLTDPGGRYLPRAIAVTVPDRRPLGAALAAGATAPPVVPAPPFLTVLIRPALSTPISEETALWGVASQGGAPLRFAWIQATSPQGVYVTYCDLRGEYVIPLSFLRPVVSGGVDVQDTFAVQVDAYPLLAPPVDGAGDPLAAFPADFDALTPGTAGFTAVYGASFFSQTMNIQIGTQARLDL